MMSIQSKNRILRAIKNVAEVIGKSLILAMAFFFEPSKRQNMISAYFPNPYDKPVGVK
jgi:hypothetical protein